MNGKLIFAALLMVLAISYAALARHAYRETISLAARLRNPEVKKHWDEQGRPQCIALVRAAHIGAFGIGLLGLISGWMAI